MKECCSRSLDPHYLRRKERAIKLSSAIRVKIAAAFPDATSLHLGSMNARIYPVAEHEPSPRGWAVLQGNSSFQFQGCTGSRSRWKISIRRTIRPSQLNGRRLNAPRNAQEQSSNKKDSPNLGETTRDLPPVTLARNRQEGCLGISSSPFRSNRAGTEKSA